MWSLAAAKRAIVVAGCLAMAYTQLTMSPATVEFARALGANALHIGILGALPILMIVWQLVAAVVANHLSYRRRLWFWVSVAQRLIFVPIALGPIFAPSVPPEVWVWTLIAGTGANHALLHFGTPLWLSWMGDYLPHQGLNHFWGVRHLWMQWAAALSLLVAVFLFHVALPITVSFAVLMIAGAVFGVADLLLFLKIDEPPVSRVPEPKLAEVLAAPLRDGDFRSFIRYSCYFHFAAMLGAPFISWYLLRWVGMDLYHLMLLWTWSWVGGALLSGRLGLLAERVGNRPLLILCTVFKSILMLALVVVPRNPVLAYWILLPVFMVDALLNAGIAIASNGFMIKNSPSRNRTMYIAAGSAWAGLVGGITSIVAGAVLVATDSWRGTLAGFPIVNYHVLFAASVVLRLLAVPLARQIREPASISTRHVVAELVGCTPLRLFRFPVGLYRAVPLRVLNPPAPCAVPAGIEPSAPRPVEATARPVEAA